MDTCWLTRQKFTQMGKPSEICMSMYERNGYDCNFSLSFWRSSFTNDFITCLKIQSTLNQSVLIKHFKKYDEKIWLQVALKKCSLNNWNQCLNSWSNGYFSALNSLNLHFKRKQLFPINFLGKISKKIDQNYPLLLKRSINSWSRMDLICIEFFFRPECKNHSHNFLINNFNMIRNLRTEFNWFFVFHFRVFFSLWTLFYLVNIGNPPFSGLLSPL